MTVTQLEAQALRLSARSRAHLAAHLLLSLDQTEDPACEKVWLDEAERRYRAYKRSGVRGRPAAEAVRAARARLRYRVDSDEVSVLAVMHLRRYPGYRIDRS